MMTILNVGNYSRHDIAAGPRNTCTSLSKVHVSFTEDTNNEFSSSIKNMKFCILSLGHRIEDILSVHTCLRIHITRMRLFYLYIYYVCIYVDVDVDT
jgi:hypothetical protein